MITGHKILQKNTSHLPQSIFYSLHSYLVQLKEENDRDRSS